MSIITPTQARPDISCTRRVRGSSFHRDQPLRHERWKEPTREDRDSEDFQDQEERLAWILALPDGDEDDELDDGGNSMWTMDANPM